MIEGVVERVAVDLLRLAATRLPRDVKGALRRAYREEEDETGRAQLRAILKNVELAEEAGVPMCQDTGAIHFYLRAGADVGRLDRVGDALRRATQRATVEVPLRPNAVDPFTGENTGDNTGRLIPALHWEIVPGDRIQITALPKGGGSENACALAMLRPSDGVGGLKRFVVDAVIRAGAEPCPPTILGVGVGGGADVAVGLAKAALLRPLGHANPDPRLAELEGELCEAVNMTGIGPMGLGGRCTALGVHVEWAHRHPACFPVAAAFQCWAARRASALVLPDGSVEYLTEGAR